LVEDSSEDQGAAHELAEELMEQFQAGMGQGAVDPDASLIPVVRAEHEVAWGAELSEEMDRLLAAQLNPSDQSHDFRVPSEDRGLDDAPSARWLRKSVTVLRAQAPNTRSRAMRAATIHAPSADVEPTTPPTTLCPTRLPLHSDAVLPTSNLMSKPPASVPSAPLSSKGSAFNTGPFNVPSAQRQTQDSAQIWISRAQSAPPAPRKASFDARRLNTEDLARLFQQTERALAHPEEEERLLAQPEPTAEYTEAEIKAILQNPEALVPEEPSQEDKLHPQKATFADALASQDETREHDYSSKEEATRKVTPMLREQVLSVAEVQAARRKLRRNPEPELAQAQEPIADEPTPCSAPALPRAPQARALQGWSEEQATLAQEPPAHNLREHTQHDRIAALHAHSERLMADRKVSPLPVGLGPSLGSAALALIAGAQAVAPESGGWPGGHWASLVPLCCAALLLAASFARVPWQLRLGLGITAGGALMCFATLPAFFHALGFFQAWAWGLPHLLAVLSLAGFARAVRPQRS
jgi:hypothetical protein